MVAKCRSSLAPPPGCGAHLLGTRRANVHHGVREESEEGEEGEGIQVREEGQEGAVVFRGRDEETAAAADAPGKAKRKANLIEWFRRCLRDDTEGARAAFVKARDYVAVANVIRAHARKPSVAGAHDEAVKLLDNKGNFLHIVQTCVDGHPEATASWDKVVKHHRAKFEKAGGADAIAEKKRAAREAKEQYKLLQKERAEREAKLKELAKLRKEYRARMDECRLKGACLDWCNLGKCKFGEECQYKHQEELKGTLVELAAKIDADNVGGKRGAKLSEEAERRIERKAAKKAAAASKGNDARDEDDNSDSEDSFDRAGREDSDSDSDSDGGGGVGGVSERKAAKRKVLSVLPGDDGSDSDSDDADVPRIVRLERARRKEEERAARAAKEKRRARVPRRRSRRAAPRVVAVAAVAVAAVAGAPAAGADAAARTNAPRAPRRAVTRRRRKSRGTRTGDTRVTPRRRREGRVAREPSLTSS